MSEDQISINQRNFDVHSPSKSVVQDSEVNKEEFNQALSLIEQIIEVKDKFKEIEPYVNNNAKSEYKAVVEEFETILQILDSEATPISIIKSSPLSGSLRRNKIERMGIAGEVVRMRRENKMTIKDIANSFGLTESLVSRFFRMYDALNPSEQSKYNRKSIFEVTERLEELQTLILSNIYRLEGVRDEVAVKYVGELRQSLELAMNVAEKINDSKQMRREYEEFKSTVFDILKKELPNRQAEIVQKMKSFMPSDK